MFLSKRPRKVLVRHDLLNCYMIVQYSTNIPHFHFPVGLRRTGAYRHKKAGITVHMYYV